MSEDRHILITGGAGYIGSALTGSLLHRGNWVTVVDDLVFGGESLMAYVPHLQFHFMRGDVFEPGLISLAAREGEARGAPGERAPRRRGAGARLAHGPDVASARGHAPGGRRRERPRGLGKRRRDRARRRHCRHRIGGLPRAVRCPRPLAALGDERRGDRRDRSADCRGNLHLHQ